MILVKLFQKLVIFFETFVEDGYLQNEREKLRFFHFLWLLVIGIFLSCIFVIYNLITENYNLAFAVTLFISLLTASFFMIKRRVNPKILYNFLNIIFLFLVMFLVYFEDEMGMRILWCYLYPISSIFLFGNKRGLIWSMAMLIGAVLALHFAPKNTEIYTSIFLVRFSITYIAVSCVTSLLEYYKDLYHLRLMKSMDDLKKERNLLQEEATKRKILQEQLSVMANTDSLTNLLNRRHFWELGDRELSRAKRYKYPVCLAILDVDDFKTINDTCGHPAGDEALRILARHCSYVLRQSDLLGRIGGEEFAFLLTHVDIKEAYAKLEKLRQEIELLKPIKDDVKITISVGVCKQDETTNSIDELYKKADKALYRAKKEGKNRVQIS